MQHINAVILAACLQIIIHPESYYDCTFVAHMRAVPLCVKRLSAGMFFSVWKLRIIGLSPWSQFGRTTTFLTHPPNADA